MGKRMLILLLALMLGMAGCSSGAGDTSATEPSVPEPSVPSAATEASPEAPSEASPGETPPAAAGQHRTPPGEDIAVSMEEYSSSMVVYTYYYSNIRANLANQAFQNGFTEETLGEFWGVVQEGKTIRELLRESALRVSKEHAILYKMAEDAETAPNTEADRVADAQVELFLAELGGDEQAFVDVYMITPAQMKEIEHRINLVDAYQEDVFDAQEVAEEEVQLEYTANPDAYELVTVRHILIDATAEMTEAQIAMAETQANELLARIQGGEEIGKLAAEFSTDGGSKNNNGEYTFAKGEMVKPFEDWAFAAAVGDQGVVKSEFGYHVMQLMADASFENVKEYVQNGLQVKKAQVVFQDVPALIDSADWAVGAGVDALAE